MKMIQKIEAFKTSDGAIFEEQPIAEVHQTRIDIREKLIKFFGNADIHIDDEVISHCYNNRVELICILQNKMPEYVQMVGRELRQPYKADDRVPVAMETWNEFLKEEESQ